MRGRKTRVGKGFGGATMAEYGEMFSYNVRDRKKGSRQFYRK